MSDPASLADLIPETLTHVREKVGWWQSLTPEQQAAQQAEWDEQDRLKREDELARWRSWPAEQMPRRFAQAHIFDDRAQSWVEAVCEDPHYRGLLIAGPTGVGKTFLLWGIYHELASRQGPRVEVVKLVKLLSSLRPGGNSDDDTVHKLCQVPILAIDDIGAQKSSEWVNERLYEIIDTRYDNCKPIIATTNRKNLHDTLDDRLVSRLQECCESIVLTGADRRTEAR